MRPVEIILGPPGTGKTTALVDTVSQYLEEGGDPERLAYAAFTRRAANEARARIGAEHADRDFPYLRTLHSLAYRLLKLTPERVMGRTDWRDFGNRVGLELTGERDPDEADFLPTGHARGDQLLRIVDYSRGTGLGLEQSWELLGEDLSYGEVRRFADDLQSFKRGRGLLDFGDMLDACDKTLDIDLLIIDEAQDLTNTQWAFARRIGRRAGRVVLAGDDDQAIYEWAGASPETLAAFRGERRVLSRSHRLPQEVWKLADSVSAQIGTRIPKTWVPREELGSVEFIRKLDQVDLSEGSWLLLARQRAGLARLEQFCRQAGVVYRIGGRWSNESRELHAVLSYERLRRGGRCSHSEANGILALITTEKVAGTRPGADWVWEDLCRAAGWPESSERRDWMAALQRMSPEAREYIRALRLRGEPLSGPGRVQVSTIHGAKGAEADNVVVVDGMGPRVAGEWLAHPDAELRVWYVAVTRARKSLFVLQDRRVKNFFP